MLLMAPIACARAFLHSLFRFPGSKLLPTRTCYFALCGRGTWRGRTRRRASSQPEAGQSKDKGGGDQRTTSLMRECTSCRASFLISSRAGSMFAIKKAASWLLAAQFFNATTVVSCMRTSCSSRRHITSALTIRVCLTIICAPSSELAPQFPRVMAAYSRAPLCSFGGSVWLSTSAIESSAPGVCAMRGRAGQPAASRTQAAAAKSTEIRAREALVDAGKPTDGIRSEFRSFDHASCARQ